MSGGVACSKVGLATVSQRDESGALERGAIASGLARCAEYFYGDKNNGIA
jgi:hypothetical protein